MLPQTIKVMKKLREINRFLENAAKINEFVDEYLDQCLLYNKPVVIISPWSLSFRFKERYLLQGNKFISTKKEINLFSKEIPLIVRVLEENGFTVEWWLVFSRAYLDSRLLPEKIEREYAGIVNDLIDKYNTPIATINWEDDVITKRHTPDKNLLDNINFNNLIPKKDFYYELDRWSNWVKQEKIDISQDELFEQTKYQIMCEAEEGRFLMEDRGNPLCKPGDFLFFVLGRIERYTFFSTLVLSFKKRIVCVLKPYPWRL